MSDERKQYWEEAEDTLGWGQRRRAILELRAAMAWELVMHFGSIAGVYMDREDSAKRAVMELQTPGTLVTRCFSIADAFVNRAENREEIRQLPEKQKPKSALGALQRSIKDVGGVLDTLTAQAGVPMPQNTEPQEEK